MNRVTVDDVSSRSYRGLEAIYLLPAVLFLLYSVGVVSVGVSQSGGSEFGLMYGPLGLLVIGYFVMALVVWLVTPVLLFLDARAVSSAGTEWQPSSGLYAVLGFFFGWLVVAHYLYMRHHHIVDRDRGESWWIVVPACFVLAVLALVLPTALGVDPVVSTSLTLGILFFSGALVSLALYLDSLHVRLNSEWQPNPATKFGLALFSVLLPILPLLYGGYYLARRRSNYRLSN